MQSGRCVIESMMCPLSPVEAFLLSGMPSLVFDSAFGFPHHQTLNPPDFPCCKLASVKPEEVLKEIGHCKLRLHPWTFLFSIHQVCTLGAGWAGP